MVKISLDCYKEIVFVKDIDKSVQKEIITLCANIGMQVDFKQIAQQEDEITIEVMPRQ